MKRIVSVLLAVCMCFSVGVMLTACDGGHAHTYNEEWAKDATHHWHACEGEGCTEVSDKAEHTFTDGVCVCGYEKVAAHTCVFKTEWTSDATHHWHACETNGCSEISGNAEHTWDDGEITTEATAQANGEKTFTCTVCEATKVEALTFEDVWNSTLEIENFENVTLALYGTFIGGYGYEFEEFLMLDGDVGFAIGEKTTDPAVVASIKNIYVNTVLGVLENFDNFTYDAENGVYKANSTIVYAVTVQGMDATITANDVVVTIDADNKLAKMSCGMKQEFDGGELNLTVTFEFSDYGTTVIE